MESSLRDQGRPRKKPSSSLIGSCKKRPDPRLLGQGEWRAAPDDSGRRVKVTHSSLVATLSVSVANAASFSSRAYLYYTDEHKHWVHGLKVEIEPKAAK